MMSCTTPLARRALALLLCALAGCAAPPDAQDRSSAPRTGHGFRFLGENDVLALNDPSDQFYTNGVRLEYKLPAESTPELVHDVARALPLFPAEPDEVTLAVFAGQSIFTPSDISDPAPRPMDRPYAGWSYGGVTLRSLDLVAEGPSADGSGERFDDAPRFGDSLDVLELQVGVVGPSARADVVQTEWHEWFDFRQPRGWQYQLKDEVGVNLLYTHAHRVAAGGIRIGSVDFGTDVIAKLGGSLGNVMTHATGGIFARLGLELPRDFGIGGIHTNVGDAGPRASGYAYVFGGVQGRAVARNVFLDGNTFRNNSPSVQREYLVGELRGGAAVGLGGFELSYSFVIQTPEFEETDHHQQFGSVMLSYTSR